MAMNDVSHVLALLAVASALTALGFGIAVASYLRERGHKANPLLVKWMMFHYLAKYKRVTAEETGEVGPLYHGCSIAAAWALIFGLAAIIMQTL
jgi:hypothetical protein